MTLREGHFMIFICDALVILFAFLFFIPVNRISAATDGVTVSQVVSATDGNGGSGDSGSSGDKGTCTSLPAETQTLSCPPGQEGAITQMRVSSCPGPIWSAWSMTSDTCQESIEVCSPLPSETQIISCPAGQQGSITQTRTSSCPGPAWSTWNTSLDTCLPAVIIMPPNPESLPATLPGEVGGDGGNGGGILGTSTVPVLQVISRVANITSDLANKSVVATKRFVDSPVGKITTAMASPVGAIAGALIVGSQAIAVSATIGSVSDFYLLMLKSLGAALGFFRRKKKPWGTVYDSITKRPLDPAYVIIKKQDGTEVSDAITDLDGRFGFFLPAGTYILEAQKTHYIFPSKKLAGKIIDEMYDHLYFGEPLTTQEGEIIVRNIPLDPIKFDWNEFAKNKQALFRLYSEKERTRTHIYNILFGIGFLTTLVTTLLDVRPYNFIFLTLYLGIIVYQVWWVPSHKARTARYESGEPLSFALIHMFLEGVERPVRSVVTDQVGRFYALVAPGSYYLTVDEKQDNESYRTIYKSEVMQLTKGVIQHDIVITRPSMPSAPTEPPPFSYQWPITPAV